MKTLLLTFNLLFVSLMMAPLSLNAKDLVVPDGYYKSTLTINSIGVFGATQKDPFRFSIKPNPSKEHLNIRIENTNTLNYKIQVFDVLGKIVLEQSLSGLSSSISVSNWKSGVYLVKISSKTFSQTKRFLKQ
jgi:hypothetical protein